MKKILMMVAVLMVSVAAKAQNEVGQITIAPTVGLNLANYSGDVEDNKMKAGLVVGAVAEYGLMEKLGVTAGLLYSMQGCKFDDESNKLGYLNIPILANYYVTDGLALKAGVQPGILLSAKEDDYDFKSDCKSIDFAIPVGASYEVSNFVIDARYNFPLTKINKGDGSVKNSVFQITLAYKFSL